MIITNVLKADKHKLLSLLQSNLPTTSKPPGPVPVLAEMVGNVYLGMLTWFKDFCPIQINQEVKKPAQARLAHMRIVLHLNRIARNDQGEKHTF
ncbi:hypothetical protein PTTG_26340 [Puccinia triticina 1-1 BBBD Race 1]|uniref:Uncharacterized protein n=1 Tax=Puccinia triticina (isolate 1-1 / race 1 (BBBD)) TaxID=630390 RepID=A0A180GWB3_PUCT1|nr:hypothetical protein PTTG_26340 [Puccinia triticina 1-1 BBBD Race 1]WAR54257.1 hypothetical protein PtB15_3B771 [Puccinia triticina]